ncbi:MAG: winged helix-turn-helix transcriptional regulator [Nitrososphaerota archaeon]|nr:winged helix-turn-helix transcriptional regulator [Nitrososphaerota archaeon]
MVGVTGELRERVISALADPESRRIITSVHSQSKAIGTIEGEVGLPQSTLYRKVSELRKCGLLMVDRFVVRQDGKKEAVYARSFDEVRLRSEEGEVRVEIIQSAKSLEKRWFELFFANPVFSSHEPPSAGSGSSGQA